MSVMYFQPTAEQIAEAQGSTCRMATPKDPRDCENSTCCHKNVDRIHSITALGVAFKVIKRSTVGLGDQF